MSVAFYISIISASVLFVVLALFVVAFVFRYNQQQREFIAEKKALELSFQNEAARSQLELSEQLLTKISQEIHDNIGASLTLAKIQLTGIDVNSLEIRSERTRELLTRAIQDLRQLSKSINGSFMLDQGLEKAIRKELTYAEGQDNRRTFLDWPDEDITFDAQTEVILFRSVQEAINNAVKHADATELIVAMVSQKPEYTITITDNGKGISAENIIKSVGFKSLETRMSALKGSFRVDSALGAGTSIILNFEYGRQK